MIAVSPEQFEDLVGEALDLIPQDLLDMIDNVAVLIQADPPEPGLLGLYDGIPLTERHDYGGFAMPDCIFIYRNPICAISETFEDVVAEVRITVVHEVAHHFGIDDDRLHELGWD